MELETSPVLCHTWHWSQLWKPLQVGDNILACGSCPKQACILEGGCNQRAKYAVVWELLYSWNIKTHERNKGSLIHFIIIIITIVFCCIQSSVFCLFLLSVILVSPLPSIPCPSLCLLCLSFAVTKIGFFFLIFFLGGEVPRSGFNQVEDSKKQNKNKELSSPVLMWKISLMLEHITSAWRISSGMRDWAHTHTHMHIQVNVPTGSYFRTGMSTGACKHITVLQRSSKTAPQLWSLFFFFCLKRLIPLKAAAAAATAL